jgi:hypothetical protein
LSRTIEGRSPPGRVLVFVIDAAGYGKNIWNQPGEQVQVLANDGIDALWSAPAQGPSLSRAAKMGNVVLFRLQQRPYLCARGVRGRL